jgi:hypothetical protein
MVFQPTAPSDATAPDGQTQSAETSVPRTSATDAASAATPAQTPFDEAEWITAARSTSGTAIRALVATDPQAAAERSLEDSEALQRLVAKEWAQRDPQGLLSFGREHIGSERHATFVHAAVRLQHRLDADAAKAWLLGLPSGPDRDILLSSLLTEGARHATAQPYVDADVLAAFAGEAERQRSFLLALHEVAKKDPAATSALIDEFAVDPSTREQAEYVLASATGRHVLGTTFILGR